MVTTALPTFSMLISELESLDQTQRLVYRATHRQVVDSHLSHYALGVDDKQTSAK
jgi:hypothetical protein